MRNIFTLILLFAAATVYSQTITVTVDKPKGEIQPTMWGIFFEDINFGADGGLYSELVKNRSFEFAMPLMGWKQLASERFSLNQQSGSVQIMNRREGHDNNPRFARVLVNGDNPFVLTNEGFFGIGVKANAVYNFSVLINGKTTLKF
jgi:alpha-N-arabinofuranosidase